MKNLYKTLFGAILSTALLTVVGNAWGYSVSPNSSGDWNHGSSWHSSGHEQGNYGGGMMDEDSDSGYTWGENPQWDGGDHQFGDHGGPDFSGWDHGRMMDGDSDSDSDTDFDYDADSDSDSDSGYGGGNPPTVPLPAPLLLLGSGLLGLVGFARRSKSVSPRK